MTIHYKLEGKMVVVCDSAWEWMEWFHTADRHVADEEIGGIRISTVFLGWNSRFNFEGDPLLFETMIFFPDGETGNVWRYFTWAEAEEGHRKVVEIIKQQTIEADYVAADVLRQLMKNPH
jgi:hypothetical protein